MTYEQLGRGLRKHEDKEFLTVIDFIDNYKNNYLIPVALTGDKTFNKDRLRKGVVDGSLITGESTINFERIAQERIFKSISKATLDSLANLKRMYHYTKNKLGHIPTLVDLQTDQDSMNPMLVLNKYDHYVRFLSKIKEEIEPLTNGQDRILTFLSKEIVDGKRVPEILLLQQLFKGSVNKAEFRKDMREKKYYMTDDTMRSIIRMFTLEFYTMQKADKYKYPLIELRNENIYLTKEFRSSLKDEYFRKQVEDILALGILNSKEYDQSVQLTINGKYSRADVCRLLNWEKDETSTIYGYKNKHKTAPIFVNYNKNDDIDESVRYDDKFLDSHIFQWYTRKGTDLTSKINREMIEDYENDDTVIHLFVKRDDDEGVYHYYLGKVGIDLKSAENASIGLSDNKHKVAKMNFILEHPLDYNMYRFIENNKGN